MFAKLSVQQRLQVGLILGMAFLLVLGSNRVDRRHFSTVQNTVNSVHDDRVVVQDLIYRLNNIFHQKELLVVQNQSNAEMNAENGRIGKLLADFGATKLTTNEARLLDQLNQQFNTLKGLEKQAVVTFAKGPETFEVNTAMTQKDGRTASGKKMLTVLNEIEKSLSGLSEIQLVESKQLTQLSNKSLGMNILLSNLEIGFMIVIGIAMLVLIFYPSHTRVPTPSEN